eukprot:Protomagalhaensia_sp_Gyna_25__1460@NODE_1741_length_1573_cov_34_080183_g1429_i0_p1_GENE_NODE_1741_length_1573_cov_34_080183_g1429_i0NODE_1741_length_1573_cov_34_080183_g1429_i0_p1_ORF_typecomplete_len274_score27_78Asp/PF00026_23/1e43TAXi_C/PF14541_6/3_5e05_NODE_1741_length_1573_cov_34_080183_g1429_i0144965
MLGIDTIRIGSMIVKNQTLGLAIEESLHPFIDLPIDGLGALGLNEYNTNEIPLIQNIKDQRILKYSRFSFYFSKDPSIKGSLTFGSIDPSIALSIDERPAIIPLVSTKYWEVAIIGIKINDQYLQICSLDPEVYNTGTDKQEEEFVNIGNVKDSITNYCPAAIDTGSSLITLPSYILNTVESVIEDNYGLQLPVVHCDHIDRLPSISFIMKDVNENLVEFQLNPDDYMIHQNSECLMGMAPLDVPQPSGPLIVLGVNFLQKYLSIFDFGKRDQ